MDKAKNEAKEEEEKRTKAIALLKTVRQKLVKAEKERDDATKDVGTLKEAERAEREKEKAERTRLQGEIEKVNVDRETTIQGLRAQFDKEVAAAKEKYEKELAALRGQYELEAITTKVSYTSPWLLGVRGTESWARQRMFAKSSTRSRASSTLRTLSRRFRQRRTSFSIKCNFVRQRRSRPSPILNPFKARTPSCSISFAKPMTASLCFRRSSLMFVVSKRSKWCPQDRLRMK